MDGRLEAVAPETQSPVSGVRSDLTQLGITETQGPVTQATLVMNHERRRQGDQYARVVLIAEYKMTKKILMAQKYAIFAKCISRIKSTIKLNELLFDERGLEISECNYSGLSNIN